MVEKRFNFIVSGGSANGGPPIGPALGPMGVNIMQIVGEINKQTADYKGVQVPVDVFVDTDTKAFTIKVGMLTTFALLTMAAKVSKGSGTPSKAPCADLPFDELVGVAKKKKNGLYAASLKAAVREVLGTAQSMGLTIDGKPANQVQDEIKSGAYDAQLKED